MARNIRTFFLLVLLAGLACQQSASDDEPSKAKLPAPAPAPLKIVLSDGQPSAAETPLNKTVEGKPLAQEEVARLLKMFKEPLAKQKERPAFFKRGGSPTPPRSVKTKEIAFPQEGDGKVPPSVKVGELAVLSVTPQGSTQHAPRVSISFNSPMIEVSDPSALDKVHPLGVTLEPRPEGKWRWLGTQTLIFEPAQGQMPRATVYRVTVPKGVKDVNGARLDKPVTQTFSLPRASVVSSSPSGDGLPLDPLLVVTFNHAVDPKTTPGKIHLRRGAEDVVLQPLSPGEAEELEKGARRHLRGRPEDTVFFFRARRSLRPGTDYTIEVEEGVVSLEGPQSSDQPWSQSFSTYSPLQLSFRYPDEGDRAAPADDFVFYFNNILDRKKLSRDWVTVVPPIEDMQVQIYDSCLAIGGTKRRNTDYKVTVSGKLKDSFQQTLGEPLVLTMKTGGAPKTMKHGLGQLTVLNPNDKPTLPVFTTNVRTLEIEVHRVVPQDWNEYLKFLEQRRDYRLDTSRPKPVSPGVRLGKSTLEVKGEPDTLQTTLIDLSPYLDDGLGNLVLTVRDPEEEETRYPRRQFATWVQGTQVGLDLDVSNKEMVALVTRLKDGSPLASARVIVGSRNASTDDNGVAEVSLPDVAAPICLVESDAGTCFLPGRAVWSSGAGWKRHSLSPKSQWFLFDDRGLYKPGETAHIKGYLRRWQRGPKGQLVNAVRPGEALLWSLHGPRGGKISEGKAGFNQHGAVEITVKFPPNTNLGAHQLRLRGAGLPDVSHSLNVQEFRRPEFEVTTTTVSEQPHLLQGSATVKATAAYYSGGGLAGSTVNWRVATQRASYTPPGRGAYTFGRWTPWWDLGPWWRGSWDRTRQTLGHQGVADGKGSHLLRMDFESMHPPAPTNVTVTASAADVNRQVRSSSTTVLVHPSQRYVGLKAEKSFADEDSDFELEALVTDIDGHILPGVPVSVQLFELVYEDGPDGYRQKENLISERSVTSTETSLKLKLSAKRGGSYKVRAEVSDESGRLNRTEYNLWKAGGKLPSTNKVDLESLTLVPSSREYKPGDKARILVMAPFGQGEGMVVWTRDGIESSERFTLKNGSATVSHPITEELLPNLRAQITVVGKSKWGGGSRPAVASGELDLSISTASRKLNVEVVPSPKELKPGAEVELEVVVKDHMSQPVSGSEVTIWIADEAILGLVGYDTPSPLGSFYGHRASGISSYHLRTAIRLGRPKILQGSSRMENRVKDLNGVTFYPEVARTPRGPILEPAATITSPTTFSEQAVGQAVTRKPPGSLDGSNGYANGSNNGAVPQDLTLRTNFAALAIYKARLSTDKSGRTTIKVKLPDNLTRYRLMTVAVEGDNRFGSSDQLLTARLPLQVRPSLPRFLNFGDEASLPVVIHNQTDAAVSARVIGQANGVEWLGPAGRQVDVPAKDRVEVRFRARADQVGQARFRFAVVAGENSDATTLSLPVYTPASGEAFATYGSLTDDEGINQPVRRPGQIWPQFGGLQVSLSSTALSELTDAYLYLYNYRFGCAEQRASRVLSVATMGEALSAFNPDLMPNKSNINSCMKADILHLTRLQNRDGGWQYWRQEQKSDPFVSVHVAHALARCKIAGFKVEQVTVDRALTYLRYIGLHCKKGAADHDTPVRRQLTLSTFESC